MSSDELKSKILDDQAEEQDVTWSSRQRVRKVEDRRSAQERRHMSGRAITVPDMRSDEERRSGSERRKIKLIITGRAIDV